MYKWVTYTGHPTWHVANIHDNGCSMLSKSIHLKTQNVFLYNLIFGPQKEYRAEYTACVNTCKEPKMVQINLSIEMDSCTIVIICTHSRMARPYFTKGHYYLWYHHLWSYIHTVTINKQQCNIVLFTFLIVSMRLTWLIGSLFFSRTTLKWLTFQYKHKYAYHIHTYITHTYESHNYVYTHKHTHIHVQGLNFVIINGIQKLFN